MPNITVLIYGLFLNMYGAWLLWRAYEFYYTVFIYQEITHIDYSTFLYFGFPLIMPLTVGGVLVIAGLNVLWSRAWAIKLVMAGVWLRIGFFLFYVFNSWPGSFSALLKPSGRVGMLTPLDFVDLIVVVVLIYSIDFKPLKDNLK